MTRRGCRVRAGAAVLAAVALLSACSGGDTDRVTLAAAERRTVTEVVDAPATVTARSMATVTSPASGRISQLFVRAGQRVSAGSLLAIIDSPETVQRLRQAEQADAAARRGTVRVPTTDLGAVQRQADEAAAQGFRAARAAAARVPDLRLRAAALAQVTAAEQRYAVARAQAAAAVDAVTSGIGSLADALASLTAAQQAQTAAAVTLARSAVAALVLRAPVAGTVQLGGSSSAAGGLGSLVGSLPEGLQQQAAQALGSAGASSAPGSGGTNGSAGGDGAGAAAIAVGAPVSAGTAVATLVDTSALGLLAEVDETDVLLVRPGVRARVDVDAVPGAAYPATVASVDLAPVTSARGGVSYRVRLRLFPGRRDGRPAPSPRPGMSAVANLSVRTVTDAVSVPASAIVRVGGKDAVWLDADGVARRRTVVLGAQGEDVVAVASGLDERDRVVVKGTDRVREGQRLP